MEVTDGQVVRTGVSVTQMHCHDMEVMSSNPCWVELGVLGTSVLISCTRIKISKGSFTLHCGGVI